MKALNIALNKISGEWNEQLLADLLVDLQDAQFNLDLTGFEAPEIDRLFSKLHNKDIEEDNFDAEEELKNPAFSQAGDIWTLGRHRVICGDSTLPETFKLLMEGKRANLVLTDPPYNVNVEETAGRMPPLFTTPGACCSFEQSTNLDVLFQPIRHIGIINSPRFYNTFIFIPVTFISVKELLSVAFVLDNFASFEPILVPIVILLPIALPFVGSINRHIYRPFFSFGPCY